MKDTLNQLKQYRDLFVPYTNAYEETNTCMKFLIDNFMPHNQRQELYLEYSINGGTKF